MTEKEFRELKVGDLVSAFVFSQIHTAIVENIAKDTGECTARLLNPLVLKCLNYYGTTLRLEPATKIAIIEADYSKLEIVREEEQ